MAPRNPRAQPVPVGQKGCMRIRVQRQEQSKLIHACMIVQVHQSGYTTIIAQGMYGAVRMQGC